VAAEPALRVHVPDPVEPERHLPLPRLDTNASAQRLVLETTCDVHQDLTAWQPALTASVDVGVADRTQTQVAADVRVPGVEAAVDLRVVAVGLERNACGRAEVHPAWDRLPRGIVDHRDADPVPARVDELDSDPP